MSLIPFTPFGISAFQMSVFQRFSFSKRCLDAPVSLSLSSMVADVPPANVHHKPLVDAGVLPLISHFRRELETVVRVGFLLVFPQVHHPSISTILLHAVFPRLPDWVVNVTRPPEQPFFGAKIEITHELELCLLFEITACRASEL